MGCAVAVSALCLKGPVGGAGGLVFRHSRHWAIVVGLANPRSPRYRGSRPLAHMPLGLAPSGYCQRRIVSHSAQ